jgi:hypothetical protein
LVGKPQKRCSEIDFLVVIAGQFRVYDQALKSLRDNLLSPLIDSGCRVRVVIHGWISPDWPESAKTKLFRVLGDSFPLTVVLDEQLPEEIYTDRLARLHHPDRFRYASQWESLSRAWDRAREFASRKTVVIRTRLDAVFLSRASIDRLIGALQRPGGRSRFAYFPLTEGHSSMPVSEGLTSDQFVCTDAETF